MLINTHGTRRDISNILSVPREAADPAVGVIILLATLAGALKSGTTTLSDSPSISAAFFAVFPKWLHAAPAIAALGRMAISGAPAARNGRANVTEINAFVRHGHFIGVAC